MSDAALGSRDQIRKGIANVMAAIACFALTNVMIKWQVALYPVGQVVFFRCLFALVPLMLLVQWSGGLMALRTRRMGGHLGRAVLQFGASLSAFAAFGLLPLAETVAIQFAAPIFVTVLSIPLLGEKVGIHRWSAVILGFCGILVMVKPGAAVLEPGAALALMNAILGALVSIGIRRMSDTESSVAIVFYSMGFSALFSLALLPFGWVTPTPVDFAMLAGIGLISAVGQFFWTQSCRFAPGSATAPFHYTGMIWAMILGYLVWGDLPTASLLIGAAIVAASGLYILYRETVRRAPPSLTTPDRHS